MKLHYRWIIVMLLGLGTIRVACAQEETVVIPEWPTDPAPQREGQLLSGFERGFEGWTSEPSGVREDWRAVLNSDPKYISEGNTSLRLDFTGISGETPRLFGLNPKPSLDLREFHALSMDVYAPDGVFWPPYVGGWFQLSLRTDSGGTLTTYGNRTLRPGWNHLLWDLSGSGREDIRQIYFAGSSYEKAPWKAPIYVDNLRLWKEPFSGLHADETLLNGLDTLADYQHVFFVHSDYNDFAFTRSAAINTDPAFLLNGSGSLKLDLTGLDSRSNEMGVSGLVSPSDRRPLAVRLDLFVPRESAPTGWWQIGMKVAGNNGSGSPNVQEGAPQGLIAGQWNTMEMTLSPLAFPSRPVAQVTSVFLNRSSAPGEEGVWRGPIYMDNVRIASETQPAPIKRDVNGDGRVNIADVTALLWITAGLQNPTRNQLTAGDLNNNLLIDVGDAVSLLQHLVGLAN